MKKKLFPSFWYIAKAENLGSMGMLFYYKSSPKIGTLVDIKIGLSQPAQTIHCTGKIIRTRNCQNSFRCGIAIEFMYIGGHEKKLLNLLITKNSE
jgi:hypothetical protein